MNPEPVLRAYQQRFASTPVVVRSPGRINLIGEHTDYSEGWVLPAAIDKEIVLVLGANGTEQCRVFSSDLQEQVTFSLNDPQRSSSNWANYIIGVVRQLQLDNHQLSGFDCVFGGDIPIGAGLSSSAALECGVGYALNEVFELNLQKLSIVRYAQNAESEFVGVNCGIMDQFANMYGLNDHLIRLDCRSLEYQRIQVDFGEYALLLFNSNVKHELGNSEYNVRRAECEQGVHYLQKQYPDIKTLRDCTLDMVESLKPLDDGVVYQRCRYVVEENQRVLTGCKDLMDGNFDAFGEKMYASHQGLSEMYEVSCPELDTLVDLTRDLSPVLGARMMGGGFGGCTINLVQRSAVDEVTEYIQKSYRQAVGKDTVPYQVHIADGTSQRVYSSIRK
jgi:galactokinase